MITYIAVVSLLSIVYAYFGYPLVLFYLSKRRVGENVRVDAPVSFSIIVAAREEKENIREKIENCLSLYTPSSGTVFEALRGGKEVELIIADDASEDGTSEIVREFEEKGVKLCRLTERGGKERAQINAVNQSSGQIMLFTDTKVRLNEDALIRASECFSIRDIGAVSSIDQVIDDNGESGEGLYVKYEMKVRELESEVGSLVGLSGSCFFVRREIALNLKPNLPSDFFSATEAIRLGYKSILSNNIIGTYKAVTDTNREFERKVRTVLRGMTALLNQTEVFDASKYGFFTFQIISHKVYRWLVPWFFILLLLTSFIIKCCSCFWSFVFWGQILVLVAAAVGYKYPQYRKNPLVKVPLFFVVSNLAILVASIRLLNGDSIVSWDPSSKG